MCKPQNNNAYSGSFVGGVHLPWALSASINICDTSATWYDANNPGIMSWGTSIGYWAGESNKYLALKLGYKWRKFLKLLIRSLNNLKFNQQYK